MSDFRTMRTLTLNGVTYEVGGVSDEEIQEKIDEYMQSGVIESTVEDWLDEHPEATTTVQDGSISMQKLSSDVQSVIASAGVKMTSVVPVGKLFNTGYVYSSWVHNNVKYDSTNDVVCVMVNCADAHVSATLRDILLYKIDPRTLKVIDKIEVNKSQESGEQFEVYGFEILANGDYMFLPCFDTGVSQTGSSKLMVWKSSDYGETWTESEATVSGLTSQNAYEWFGLTQLASGRLLCTEYKTSAILHSDDNGETWTGQRMSGSTHEPTFIDCGDGKIVCLARKTMYGTSNGTWNGTKQVEPAVYHKSSDGGATWTFSGDSSVTEMTASNCACVVDNGYADLYVCSRMPHGDALGVIYQYQAKLADIYNNTWGTPKVVLYPTTSSGQDFSYIGAAKDNRGVQHIFYYDSNVINETEIRYAMASRSAVPVPVNADVSLAPSLPYSKEKVEAFVMGEITRLQTVLYDYIIEHGGDIPDEDSEGTYYVTDGLYEYFDFTDESAYDATTWTHAGKKNVFAMKRSTATWGQSNPQDTSFNNWADIVYMSNNYDFSNDFTTTNGYSFELWIQNDSPTLAASTGSVVVFTDSKNSYGKQFNSQRNTLYGYYYDSNNQNKLFSMSSSMTSSDKPLVVAGKAFTHMVVVCDLSGVYAYVNGELTMKMVYANIQDFDHVKESMTGVTFMNTANQYHLHKLRLYNRALTADEIRNNYKYEQNLVS